MLGARVFKHSHIWNSVSVVFPEIIYSQLFYGHPNANNYALNSPIIWKLSEFFSVASTHSANSYIPHLLQVLQLPGLGAAEAFQTCMDLEYLLSALTRYSKTWSFHDETKQESYLSPRDLDNGE